MYKMYLSACIIIFGFVQPIVQLEYHLSPPDKIFIKSDYGHYNFVSVKYNGIESKIPLLSNYHMISGLQPCTKYSFDFFGYTKRWNSEEKLATKNITTSIGINQPLHIEHVVTDPTAITIKFNFTQIDCIDFIEISVNDYNRTYRSVSESETITSLTPCTTYSLMVSAAINNHRYLIYKDTVTTSSVEIKPVEDIKFDKLKNNIIWSQPQLGASCVTKYTLILKTDLSHHQNEIYIDTSQSYYEFQMLRPCSLYNVTIIPNGRHDLYTSSVFETGCTDPHEAISTSTMDCDLYSDYSKNITAIHYGARKTTLILNNPKQCISYEVSVCLSAARHNCVGKTFDFSNYEDMTIGNVSNISSATNNTITTVTWHPPTLGTKCINYYSYELYKNTTRVDHGHTMFAGTNLYNLVPCEEYELQIQSYSKDHKVISQKSIHKFRVEPQAKPAPPSSPELIARTSTSLTVKSEYKKLFDTCPIKVVRFICWNEKSENLIILLKNVSDRNTFNVTFTKLKPSSNYLCQVSVRNSAMWSKKQHSNVTFSTASPLAIKIWSSTKQSIYVDLADTKLIVGQTIMLTVIKLHHNYRYPEKCSFQKYNEKFEIRQTKRYEIKHLEPSTNYSIQMAIHMADASIEYSNIIYKDTDPGDPPKVLNAQVAEKTISPLLVTIKMDLPCQLNGPVHLIQLKLIESGPSSSGEHRLNITIPINVEKLEQNYSLTYTSIHSDRIYNVSITTTRDLISSDETLIIFRSPPQMPDFYKLPDWGIITPQIDSDIQIMISLNSTRRAMFRLTHNVSILIANLADCNDIQPSYKLYDLDGYTYEPPRQISNPNCIKEYRAYSLSSQLMIQSCVSKQNNCTQPLVPGSTYKILLRIYTSRGYTDTNPILLRTENKNNILIRFVTIFLVIVVLLAICVGAMWWLYKTQTKVASVPTASTRIVVEKFTDYCDSLDPNIIIDEYNMLSKINVSSLHQLEGVKHQTKNRYSDIIPYDFNRVILTPNNYCLVDYINASYINGFRHRNKYIATQGPCINTVYDFWHMVAEQKCHKIAMLTQFIENGTIKCVQYYPNLDESMTIKDLVIRNGGELNMGMFIRRELILSKGPAKCLVIQYQFLAWPDHGCPDNEKDLIDFVRFIKNENKSSQPIVVHCSAGVGRTGTYIVLDILLDEMKRTNSIDIYSTVKQLRLQRSKSVQTIEQYMFLYSCIDYCIKSLKN